LCQVVGRQLRSEKSDPRNTRLKKQSVSWESSTSSEAIGWYTGLDPGDRFAGRTIWSLRSRYRTVGIFCTKTNREAADRLPIPNYQFIILQ